MKDSARREPASRRVRKLLVQVAAAAALVAAAFGGGEIVDSDGPVVVNDPTGIIDGR